MPLPEKHQWLVRGNIPMNTTPSFSAEHSKLFSLAIVLEEEERSLSATDDQIGPASRLGEAEASLRLGLVSRVTRLERGNLRYHIEFTRIVIAVN
jgi:hypothetical protein